MELIMASGTFRLKGRELFYTKGLATRKVKNKGHVASLTGWSPTTVAKWVEDSDNLTGFDLDNMAKFFLDVLGMSPEEVLDTRMGDLFKFVPKDEEPKAAE